MLYSITVTVTIAQLPLAYHQGHVVVDSAPWHKAVPGHVLPALQHLAEGVEEAGGFASFLPKEVNLKTSNTMLKGRWTIWDYPFSADELQKSQMISLLHLQQRVELDVIF